ncbi:MAG TPA: integrase [Candidatus Jacksonbacteria bacterium]|nr:integrase [Candidatus Jacksonbacteria bacterium]
MNDSHLCSIAHLNAFLKVSKSIEFRGASQKEKYTWIEIILGRFRYFSLRKKDKTSVKSYLTRMTGYSDSQMTRLISKKKRVGKIVAYSNKRHHFPTRYTPHDIALLAETDLAHEQLSGYATKRILVREYEQFHHDQYEHLTHISVSHLYNLRGTRQYMSRTKYFTKTSPTQSAIGERRKPRPEGKPGFLRVDTVHQGDMGGEKGVYHINLVDEVLQWEVVGAVEGISEQFLSSLLEELLNQFPFCVKAFHSDNGSEYINHVVAKLLNTLLVKQTKSRARHCNDNALVESKNGAVVRKHMGYAHIPRKYATPINEFYQEHFNVYLNYHRPCGFATVLTDEKGKQKKVYQTYQTPYERLRALPEGEKHLRKGMTFEILDKIEHEQSDNECALLMQKAKHELFATFKK